MATKAKAKKSVSKTTSKVKSKMKKVMHEYKTGTLRSGKSNKKVKSRKQAVAIGLSEARAAGAPIPKNPKKSGSRGKRMAHTAR
jgi:hypothetical protein